jgi:hypothetical protein
MAQIRTTASVAQRIDEPELLPATIISNCQDEPGTPRHCWARNLKNVAQKQNAIYKKERNKQNAIALLNCLKRIAPQQIMLRTQVSTKTFYSANNATLLNRLYLRQVNSAFCRIQTRVLSLPSVGHNHYANIAYLNTPYQIQS